MREVAGGGWRATGSSAAWQSASVRQRLGRLSAPWRLGSFPTGFLAVGVAGGAGGSGTFLNPELLAGSVCGRSARSRWDGCLE